MAAVGRLGRLLRRAWVVLPGARRLFASAASAASSSSSSTQLRSSPARCVMAAGALQPRRGMFIQTQETPNPQSLKFIPGVPVLPEGARSLDFQSFGAAQGVSPLAAQLFGLEHVRSVFLGADFVSVSIGEEGDWMHTKPLVFGVIMDFFASGEPVLAGEGAAAAAASDTLITEDDSDVVAFIKELIETRIRPAVQQDGGDIVLHGFDEASGVVRLQLQGSCVGCPSASVTLKSGIETMLMHYVPEVSAVEEYVDPEQERVDAIGEEEFQKLEEGLAKLRAARKEGGGGD